MREFQRLLSRALAPLCLGALLAASAAAGERIKLADGTVIDGDAIDYDEGTKTLTFRLNTGRQVKYTVDQLDPKTVYMATYSKVAQDNGPGQLKLANYARDIGLYAHAARRYRLAVAADPSLKPEVDKEVEVLKTKAGSWALDNARKAMERQDLRTAEDWLKRIIEKLPDTTYADQARTMLQTVYKRELAPAARTVAAPASASASGTPADLLETDLKKGKQHYDKMVEMNKAGLTQDRTGSKAVKQWEGAIKEGQRALSELDKADKKYTDAATVAFLKQCRSAVGEQIIEAHLNLASMYMTRTSFNSAVSETNKALALDPQNAQALAMRSRIENASGHGWGWW